MYMVLQVPDASQVVSLNLPLLHERTMRAKRNIFQTFIMYLSLTLEIPSGFSQRQAERPERSCLRKTEPFRTWYLHSTPPRVSPSSWRCGLLLYRTSHSAFLVKAHQTLSHSPVGIFFLSARPVTSQTNQRSYRWYASTMREPLWLARVSRR